MHDGGGLASQGAQLPAQVAAAAGALRDGGCCGAAATSLVSRYIIRLRALVQMAMDPRAEGWQLWVGGFGGKAQQAVDMDRCRTCGDCSPTTFCCPVLVLAFLRCSSRSPGGLQ